jgi:hypothetical protein
MSTSWTLARNHRREQVIGRLPTRLVRQSALSARPYGSIHSLARLDNLVVNKRPVPVQVRGLVHRQANTHESGQSVHETGAARNA